MSDILDEVILYKNGCFRRVRRYLRGMHPERGIIVRGLTGWETLEEVSEVVPTNTFEVIDLTPSEVQITEVEDEGKL